MQEKTTLMKATILIFALAAATSAASAATITSTLCDTGVVTGCASETPLAAATSDGNFMVTADPGVGTPPFPADTITSLSFGYLSSGGNPIGTATADWITTGTGTPPTDATALGLYNYQETITTSGAGTFTFTGAWATDNCGTILVNNGSSAITGTGTTIGGGAVTGCSTTISSYFSAVTSFSFTVALNSGTNFLDFNVWNSAVSPTALLVENLAATGGSTSATPEPSSVLLVLTGLTLLGGAIVRRRR
jgi:hypothetical protein